MDRYDRDEGRQAKAAATIGRHRQLLRPAAGMEPEEQGSGLL